MARYNLQIKVGTYTGNGVDNTDITTVGFLPQLVLVKGGANISCFLTRNMGYDSCAFTAGNTANFSGGIKRLISNGFRIGTDAKVNANGTTYYYLAIRGTNAQQYFRTFTYLGNASDSRQLNGAGLFFTPDIAWVKGDTAQNPSTRTAAVTGDNSWHFSGSIDAANEIQNFITNGLELGTSARVNGSNLTYYGVALKHYSGLITSGTYTGNGIDNRAITGLGFRPDFVLVKDGSTTTASILRTSDFSGDSSSSLGSAGPTTNQIQNFLSNGFEVGTAAGVNTTGETYWWFALKAGNFNVPLSRSAA